MTPRWINRDDFQQILTLWQACFGDGEAYVRLFWEECPWRGLAAEEDGRLASMLFLLPGGLALRGRQAPASYVYAVATLPDYRGRGFAGALTERAAQFARAEGQAALCLLPASESLYGYYAKLGFVNAFAAQQWELPQGFPALEAFDADWACRSREDCWGRLGCFAWGPAMLRYMAREHLFNGGALYREAAGYAFVSEQGVKERCVCAPGSAPGGMLRPLDERGARWLDETRGLGYLGLTLE
ncbi:MAG: GNAT family N-acetyltransferase [Oscillospiraceae bacterium]|jgi:GNAT superfamily N-acetyltransferase|nr:GNAT family N-acetyltransferase [Oscillospiraceae bacterium]